jgi:hypothetical protein
MCDTGCLQPVSHSDQRNRELSEMTSRGFAAQVARNLCHLRRFLQQVLQKIWHYGFLSRRSNIRRNDVRAAILESLCNVEPDLELEDWCVPTLRPPSPLETRHRTRTVRVVRAAALH